MSTQGNVDATNVSSKLREGWEPVKAEDHPEITMVTTEQRTVRRQRSNRRVNAVQSSRSN